MREDRKRKIRIAAEKFRDRCQLRRYGIIDLFSECKKAGFKLIRDPLGDDSILGFVKLQEEDIIIFTNSNVRLSREIFTLAHEIGHAMLHIKKGASFVDTNGTIQDWDKEGMESEANYFAACLLMPADEVNKFIDLELSADAAHNLTAVDIAKVMSEFNVSYDMALNRLNHLGKIDLTEKTALDLEKTEKRVGNLLRSTGGNSRLNIAGVEIDIPFEYMDYVIFNYNHKAIPRETLERVLSYYRLTMEDIGDQLADIPEEQEDLDLLIGELSD